MKPVLAILGLAIAFVVVSLVLSRPKGLDPYPQDKPTPPDQSTPTPSAGGKPGRAAPTEQFNAPREGVMTADLTIKNVGTLTAEFYPKAAPKAVAQITGLIK